MSNRAERRRNNKNHHSELQQILNKYDHVFILNNSPTRLDLVDKWIELNNFKNIVQSLPNDSLEHMKQRMVENIDAIDSLINELNIEQMRRAGVRIFR